jgi:hypothetical protein
MVKPLPTMLGKALGEHITQSWVTDPTSWAWGRSFHDIKVLGGKFNNLSFESYSTDTFWSLL